MENETPLSDFDLNYRRADASMPYANEGELENSPTLEHYTRDKLLLTHQIRLLENLCHSRESKERASRCHELMVKLAEDRFTLAVVGQFKRGKSSLMNALIGRELLPIGVLPLTSAITILRYGPMEKLVVTWEDSSLEHEEPLSALNDYVSEKGNPGNRKRVGAVDVEVPSPFLRRGLEFVDTPGVGSAIEENTATTDAFIPSCDAVVFVTGVDAPMTEVELNFLRRLRRDVGKVFCVVNKIDLLDDAQRSQVIEFVAAQIRDTLDSSEVPVFPVSSRLALAESIGDGQGAGNSSGVAEFRQELGRFLSRERASVLLRAISERALRLLAVEQDDMLLAQRAAGMSTQARQARAEQIGSRFDAVRQNLSDTIDSMAKDIRAAVVESAVDQLDERIQLGIIDLADGLATSIAPGDWELAKGFVSVLTSNVAESAQMELNEWLANRAHTVESRLGEAATTLRDATLRLLADAEATDELIPDGKRQFDELKITFETTAAEQLRIESAPWAPVLPRLIGNMPVSVVRRRVRTWLHRSAKEYGVRLREKAVGVVDNCLAAQVRRMRDLLNTFVHGEEERLGAISPLASITKSAFDRQTERARQIGDALVQILGSVNGEPRRGVGGEGTLHQIARSDPVASEFIPAPVTEASSTRDLRSGGCAVCRQLARVLFDFLAKWQYLMAVDDAAQRQYAHERGFCPLHTWQLASISSPRGLSVGYPRIAERLRTELRAIARNGASADAVRHLAAKSESCRACQTLTSVQANCIEALSDLLVDDAGRQCYAASRVVCLKHLSPLLAEVQDAATKRFLIDVAATYLGELEEDMQNFALKQEATRRELIKSNERRALQGALESIAGFKSLCFPWDFDELSYGG